MEIMTPVCEDAGLSIEPAKTVGPVMIPAQTD